MLQQSLTEKAEVFKRKMNNTFFEIWGVKPFMLSEDEKGNIVIKSEKTLITKSSNRSKIYGDFHYILKLDRELKYLSIYKSNFKFFIDEDSSPIFRFEFDKVKPKNPRAHFHIHLDENGILTEKVSDVFNKNVKKDKRKLSTVHFPLGGALLRPCLEDILMALDKDMRLGLSKKDRSVLFEQVNIYRQIQTKAIYREYLEKDYGPLTLLSKGEEE